MYEGGRVERIDFFPRKVANLFKCPLRVAAKGYPPLFMRTGLNLSHLHMALEGIEGLILIVLANQLNFTIDLLPEPIESTSISPNFTTTGIFAQIDHGLADIAIGGLSHYTSELQLKYSFSDTYYQSPLVLVLRRGIQFGPIAQLFNPFDGVTWFLNFLLYFMGISTIISVSRSKGWIRRQLMGKSSPEQFTNHFFAMTLGYSISTVSRRNVVRIFFCCWLFYSYFMRSAYQGAMFDSFRKNCETRLPDTIEGLINEKYEIITTADKCAIPYSILFNHTKQIDVAPLQIFSFVQNSIEKIAALALLDQLSLFNFKNKNGDGTNLAFIHERFSDTQFLMFYSKHSFLREPFNNELRKMQENGMIAIHANIYANRKFNKYDVNFGVKFVITGDRLLGIFTLFLGMLVFSFLVFLCEILIDKYTGALSIVSPT